MQDTGDTVSATVKWVVFSDGTARLRRIILPDERKGLLLQFGRTDRSGAVRERALAAGFRQAGESGNLVMMAPPSPTRFNAPKLAELLDGEIYDMPRDRIEAEPWTIDYRKVDRKLIGRNFLDEEVYRTLTGVRLRKAIDRDGKAKLVHENSRSNPAEFLRAVDANGLNAIAAGILNSASRGVLDTESFRDVLELALEPLAGSARQMDRATAERVLREELLRQAVNLAVVDDKSRQSYHKAMRISENAAQVLNERLNGDAGFFPSAGFLIFLRRFTKGIKEVELAGSKRLAFGLPVLRSSGPAPLQVADLTVGDAGGIPERASNLLARRLPDGSSILVIEGNADSAIVEAVRFKLGLAYSVEVVAQVSPLVASGSHEGGATTLFFVGSRRPSVVEALPKAALRTFSVVGRDDLDELYTELLRSKKRIQDWDLGIAEQEAREAEEREDNDRQRPYVPISRASAPFTMISKSLEGGTAKALQRIAGQSEGDVDGAVAGSLGMSKERLKSTLTAEQVDAVALRSVARKHNRGFLLADQTGIGKGRSLAAMARQHLRSGGKVLYFTENAEINIPDVWRDVLAVGGQVEARPTILASRPVTLTVEEEAEGTDGQVRSYRTLSAGKRKATFESGAWPSGSNLVITNYSQFNGKPTRPSRRWAETAPDENTLLILDEAHNALNPGSNTGESIRTIIGGVGRANVIYATATPLRNPKGADLYKALLPDVGGGRLYDILDSLSSGGETAQESFTTMLAEDGVLLRRDHNLSNIEFQVRLPDDDRLTAYQEIMNLFSPLFEEMLDASLAIGAVIGHAQAARFQQLIEEGYERQAARAQTNALYQHSGGTGGPLARLARLMINAIKVDQVVEEALNEISEGRKPLITFHSTGASLFNEITTDRVDFEVGTPMSLQDQIARVANGIFKIRFESEAMDARDLNPAIREHSSRIFDMIRELPRELPVSPVDRLIERLAESGIDAGEISGRTLAYRNDSIVRREDTDRRTIVNAFNDGRLDVLIYNMAGATGGSYHAAPEFGDQRPRTLIEMETPIDIIKYIQAQGRGNRYGQVARPRIVSVMTGLTPELRILQQRNRKLRAMGASVDGNRFHPLLNDDVPDFLNVIGDLAVANVLQSDPEMARRLGFLEFAEMAAEGTTNPYAEPGAVTDSGASRSLVESVANKVLTRSIVLTAEAQSRLIDHIRVEFDAIVEELESQNANPLRPKELPGEVEIQTRTLYSGIESGNRPDDVSTFLAPLYIATGVHHYTEDPISGEHLLSLVDQSRAADGADGFARFADQVESILPTALAHLVRPGTTIEDALANPDEQRYHFRVKHARLTRLISLLRNVKLGRVMQIDGEEGLRDNLLRTIVKLKSPLPGQEHNPKAYKIRTVAPGDSRPEIRNLSMLCGIEPHRIRFLPGLEFGFNEQHIRTFSEQARLERRFPVQILTGNLLAAITEARRHSLGTMSVFRERSGQTQRGIVVSRAKIDLQHLPALFPSARVASAFIATIVNADSPTNEGLIWSGSLDRPSIVIECIRYGGGDGPKTWINVVAKEKILQDEQLDRFRAKATRLQHYELLRWEPTCSPDMEQLLEFLVSQAGVRLQTSGINRKTINKIGKTLEEGESPEMYRFSPERVSVWPPDHRHRYAVYTLGRFWLN